MKPRARKENIVVQNTANETLVYDLGTNKALVLNETSGFIWNLCDGNRDILQIQNEVSKQFKQSASEDFIWFAIDQLKKDSLLESDTELPNHFAGLNRRQIIKKVGLGTMIALPLIVSLVAPTSLIAQSGAMSCTMNSDCPQNPTVGCCISNVCIQAQQVPFMGLCVDDCQCFLFCDNGLCQ